MQKLILVYIGVKTKAINKRYMKRSELTRGLLDILHEKKGNRFFVAVSQAVTPLIERGLLSKRGTFIGLTKEGKVTTRDIIDFIKSEYGSINWDVVYEYYTRREEAYDPRAEKWERKKVKV